MHNRVSSNIAKVDRTGQVISCGPTPMEAAVMSRGGRVPDTVAAAGTIMGFNTTPQASEAVAPNNNVISSRYIAAAAAAATTGTRNQQMPSNAAYAPSISSVYSSSSGLWGFSSHLQSACSASSSGNFSDGKYTYMDEEYMRCMQTHMQWDRENGIIHLMPIAVVYQEDL